MIDHLQLFAEFCKYEKLTGGPDPHLAAVVALSKDLSFEEQVWRVALYAGFYNVPTAEACWREFPVHPGDEELRAWLHTHWNGLKFRRERKTVGLDGTRGTLFTIYALGVHTTLKRLPGLREAPFEEVWAFALSLPHVGRYAATKLCECWHRLGLVEAAVPDVRPLGGWSPRHALNVIFGDNIDIHAEKKSEILKVDDQASKLWHLMKASYTPLTYYEMEVMLCEYKASFFTKRQYPGRSLDSELSYERELFKYWQVRDTDHLRIRQELSPAWALGEIQGWDPKERLLHLGRVVSTHGYTWSDSLYDYRKTLETSTFASPVRKGTV